MKFEIITIFPDFFRGPLDYGIVRRAREAGLIEIGIHDLRAFAHDRHRTVDDRPFGGGEGMVLKPEPIFECLESLGVAPRQERVGEQGRESVVLLSPQGQMFTQAVAQEMMSRECMVLICGRYEGVDERVAEHLATDEISIGDFVLSGGELAAALVLDAVTRLLPGALGNEASAIRESFSEPEPTAGATPSADAPVILPDASRPATIAPGLLDCPHYTRPAEFRGWQVPDVLVGGNHVEIRVWRRKMGLRKTLRNRPDLLAGAPLSAEDRRLIQELRSET